MMNHKAKATFLVLLNLSLIATVGWLSISVFDLPVKLPDFLTTTTTPSNEENSRQVAGVDTQVSAPQDQFPDLSAAGPWDNSLWISETTDILVSTRPTKILTGGTSPTIARLPGNKIVMVYLSYDENDRTKFEKLAAIISTDNGHTWSNPELITIGGFPGDLAGPKDPSLLIMPDGKVKLYFSSFLTTRQRGDSSIYSAVSSDGVNYIFEPGIRLGLTGASISNISASYLGGKYHIVAPLQPTTLGAYHAVSTDSLNLIRADNLPGGVGQEWLGSLLTIQDKLYFYGGGWVSESTDGVTWKSAKRLQGFAADAAVLPPAGGKNWLVIWSN